jgi:hypothetical protein
VSDTSGYVGVGTDSVTHVLTIVQNSDTDPVADAWTTYSSRRWKTEINTLENCLSLVHQLRGVSYAWKANGKKDIGFIAEEVGLVIPEVVTYEKNNVDAQSLDYSRLVPILVEAVKEQQRLIESQQEELLAVTKRLEAIEHMILEK